MADDGRKLSYSERDRMRRDGGRRERPQSGRERAAEEKRSKLALAAAEELFTDEKGGQVGKDRAILGTSALDAPRDGGVGLIEASAGNPGDRGRDFRLARWQRAGLDRGVDRDGARRRVSALQHPPSAGVADDEREQLQGAQDEQRDQQRRPNGGERSEMGAHALAGDTQPAHGPPFLTSASRL